MKKAFLLHFQDFPGAVRTHQTINHWDDMLWATPPPNVWMVWGSPCSISGVCQSHSTEEGSAN